VDDLLQQSLDLTECAKDFVYQVFESDRILCPKRCEDKVGFECPLPTIALTKKAASNGNSFVS